MPLLDLHIAEGALDADAEARLVARTTRILTTCGGFGPDDPYIRSVSWAFVHRSGVFVAGESVTSPLRYRIDASRAKRALRPADQVATNWSRWAARKSCSETAGRSVMR